MFPRKSDSMDSYDNIEKILKRKKIIKDYYFESEHLPDKKLTFPAKLLSLLSKNDNSVICPYGIKTILSMVAEGASEDSLQEIINTLGFETLEELRKSVVVTQNEHSEAFSSENNLTVVGLDLLETFEHNIQQYYDATLLQEVDENKQYMVLKNIAGFKGKWLYKMQRDASHRRKFENADGTIARPAYLSNDNERLRCFMEESRVNISESLKAIALPYQVNKRKVPYELILVDSRKSLTEKDLHFVLSNMRERECEVVFPEFDIKNEHNLVSMMQSLGLVNIFLPSNPAFTRIATKELYAEEFKQEAEIKVDKEGTIAKATTKMRLVTWKSMSSFKEQFIFSEPFYYFLRNINSGEIIFMGRVNKLDDCEREISLEDEEKCPVGLYSKSRREVKRCRDCNSEIQAGEWSCPNCGKKLGFAAIWDKF